MAEQDDVVLDMDLDDIDDLPGFTTFPGGVYDVELTKSGGKLINGKKAFEIELKLEEIVEISEVLADEEEPPKAGDLSGVAFMLEDEKGIGKGKLKEFMKPISKVLGITNLNELGKASVGMKLRVVVKRTEKDDRKYQKIVKVAVL